MTAHLISDLTRLVAIPSIGAIAEHADDLRASAELVADLLRAAGCPDVRLVAGPYAPAVIGRYPAPPGAPTIGLYCHHDVQPIGDPAAWAHPAFTLTQVGDRLYGRGAADDKGGLAAHLATLRALGPTPPVGLTIFVEGEEEIGSPHINAFIADQADLIRADAYVILDAGNVGVGRPGFTTSLRGVCDAVIELSTLDHPVHSGQFGGFAPDALTALCRLLASFHTDDGDVAIAGLTNAPPFGIDYPAESVRAESGMLPGVADIGTGTPADRLWGKPALTVIGLDTVSVAQSSNTLLASARARVSLRVPPGMRSADALEALVAHCQAHAPWGARVEVTRGGVGNPSQVGADGPLVAAALAAYHQAFGVPVELVGMGGSIPLTGELRAVFPQAEFIVSGVADPDTRAHGFDESVSLADLERTVAAQVGFLSAIGAGR